jgi:hypothetical protein
LTLLPPVHAMEEVRITASIISASNQGSDFNLVNDQYRDELIKLFSYSSYNQLNSFAASLKQAERQHFELSGGYELILTLQGLEKDRVLVQAIIRKDNRQYVDTVLSILRPGVVFLGGPALPEGGELIIVLETGF